MDKVKRETMPNFMVLFIAGLATLASAQIPSAPTQFPETKQSNIASSDSASERDVRSES